MKRSILFLLIIIVSINYSYADNKAIDSSKKIAMKFIDYLQEQDAPKAHELFDQTMKNAAPLPTLINMWMQLNMQNGAFRSYGQGYANFQRPYYINFLPLFFEKDSILMRLVVSQDFKVSGLFFQEYNGEKLVYQIPKYADTSKFRETDLKINEGSAWELPAKLCIPISDKPVPAVVLVHGSGPNDMDETIGPNKPFKDLAYGLASNGIAVLRYDKRTKAHQMTIAMLAEKLTVNEETVYDALYAANLLLKFKEINKNKIFIAGHSLGGIMIPRIAKMDTVAAGFVMIAGLSKDLPSVSADQYRYLFGLDGSISADDSMKIHMADLAAERYLNKEIYPDTPKDSLPLKLPANYWIDLLDYNSAVEASKTESPMYIIATGRDYQVNAHESDSLYSKYLSDKPKIIYKNYPRLNHLLQEGDEQSTPSEYNIFLNVSEEIITDIVKWIKDL